MDYSAELANTDGAGPEVRLSSVDEKRKLGNAGVKEKREGTERVSGKTSILKTDDNYKNPVKKRMVIN